MASVTTDGTLRQLRVAVQSVPHGRRGEDMSWGRSIESWNYRNIAGQSRALSHSTDKPRDSVAQAGMRGIAKQSF